MTGVRFRTALAAIRSFVRVVARQIVGDRVTLFFLVVLPVVVITVIGLTFGSAGSSFDIGYVRTDEDGLPGRLIERLDDADGVGVVAFDDAADLRAAVRRQTVALGLEFADDVDARLAASEPAITVVAEASAQSAQGALDVVRAAVAAELGPDDAARFAASLTGTSFETAEQVASTVAGALPPLDVAVTDVGEQRDESLSEFALTAPQNLVLFVFINAMAGGAALVRMRRRGVLRRVMAGPVSATDIVLGITAAWFLVSLMQSALIMAVGAIAFDVSWGDPVGAFLLAVVFAAVGAGAGLLVGAVGGDEDRVSSISPPVGIVLGALGGCMVPLEIFPDAMRTVSRFVPQSWAMTGWERLVFDGEGVSAIVGPLAVLAGFAAVFVGLAVVALHRDLRSG